MDGVAAIRAALVASSDLLQLVPSARIQAGALPQGTNLPALSLASLSKVDRQPLTAGPTRHVTERVQVTIHAASYPSQKAIEHAVRAAAAETFPTVASLSRVTIHTDGGGPDFMNEEASIYLGTQDFRVTYSEDR